MLAAIYKDAHRYYNMWTVPILRYDFQAFNGLRVSNDIVEDLWSVLLDPEYQ